MDEVRARRLPKSLKEIAMMELIHMVIERFISRILHPHEDIDPVGGFDAIRRETLAMRDWMYESLSYSFANEVQELIMKSMYELESKVDSVHPGFKYVQLLALHTKCHKLNSKFFSRHMIGYVIDMLQSLIYLQHIEWTVLLSKKETDQFATNLKYCTELKIFVHKSGCSDEIIKALLLNCPLLSALDVRDSKMVTDLSANYIEKMKSLTKCYIKGTSITVEGAFSILKYCTQLYELDMLYNTCNMLQRFECGLGPIQLSLRAAVLSDYRNAPYLLKKYCPFLTRMYVDVDRLKIEHPSYYSALDTSPILQNINVITLFLAEMSDKDLVLLSNGCQNITELNVNVKKVTNNTHSFSEDRPFQKLKRLRFEMRLTLRYSRRTHASIFKILLSYSTMIIHVDIKHLRIDDGTVETVSKTNRMRYLQYWRMEKTVCTSRTFYLLFNMCPMLNFIGMLRTWSIHPGTVQEIENFIRQENFNLDVDISDQDASLRSIINRAKGLL